MYQYRNGAKAYNGPAEMSTMMVVGTLLYYQYGMLNCCNRLSTELGVEFGWRAEHFRYLTRCALLNGEKKIARKYINILKKTTFFKDWAAWAENLMKQVLTTGLDSLKKENQELMYLPDLQTLRSFTIFVKAMELLRADL